jgi:stringent starvation protein B
MAETSTKPYMIRALYEWCCDNGYTPYLAVAVDEHTVVPRQHVKGGEIVLNVSPMATSRLSLGNELVEFQARFSGVAQQISIPVGNVSAIYARETGQGMAFEVTQARPDGSADLGDEDDRGSLPQGEGGERHHVPGSTVQSLRGGARRRGPRSVDLNEAPAAPETAPIPAPAGDDQVHAVTDEADGSKAGVAGGEPAANSRKRSSKGQGSADVLAFAPSGDAAKKKGGSAASRSRSSDAVAGAGAADGEAADDEDPPPGEGGGKGRKARLTRVK